MGKPNNIIRFVPGLCAVSSFRWQGARRLGKRGSPTKQGCKGWGLRLFFELVSSAISPCGCWVQIKSRACLRAPCDSKHGSTGRLFGSLVGSRWQASRPANRAWISGVGWLRQRKRPFVTAWQKWLSMNSNHSKKPSRKAAGLLVLLQTHDRAAGADYSW